MRPLCVAQATTTFLVLAAALASGLPGPVSGHDMQLYDGVGSGGSGSGVDGVRQRDGARALQAHRVLSGPRPAAMPAPAAAHRRLLQDGGWAGFDGPNWLGALLGQLAQQFGRAAPAPDEPAPPPPPPPARASGPGELDALISITFISTGIYKSLLRAPAPPRALSVRLLLPDGSVAAELGGVAYALQQSVSLAAPRGERYTVQLVDEGESQGLCIALQR